MDVAACETLIATFLSVGKGVVFVFL